MIDEETSPKRINLELFGSSLSAQIESVGAFQSRGWANWVTGGVGGLSVYSGNSIVPTGLSNTTANPSVIRQLNPTTMEGIYRFDDKNLTYCWSAPGQHRPEAFTVPEGSGRTLITLKPFTTGEEGIQDSLIAGGAVLTTDEHGRITSIQASGAVVDEVVAASPKLTKLYKLDLEDVTLDPAELDNLVRGDSVTHLRLVSSQPIAGTSLQGTVGDLQLSGRGVTDETLLWLSGLEQIGALHLTGTSITDRGATQFVGVPVRTLSIPGIRVSDEALGSLVAQINPNSLSLNDTNAARETIAALSKGEALKRLNIANTRVTDDDMKVLGKRLNLQTLDISSNVISDQGLAELIPLKYLRNLTLDQTRITDESLALIAREFPALHSVHIRRISDLSDAGLVELAKHPRLRIVHISERWFSDSATKVLSESGKTVVITDKHGADTRLPVTFRLTDPHEHFSTSPRKTSTTGPVIRID